MLDVDALLHKVADRMQSDAAKGGGLTALGERRHMEPAFAAELEQLFPGLAEKDRKIAVPCWPGVGNGDAIVRSAPASPSLRLAIELKWAASGQIYEAIWDLFKMALLACRDDVEWACLATAAPVGAWSSDLCSDLFESKAHDTVALCARRDARGHLMWDEAIKGGRGGFPSFVPASIQTQRLGSVPVNAGKEEWEIRLVRVEAHASGLVRFTGGWPHGDRPEDAKHPARK